MTRPAALAIRPASRPATFLALFLILVAPAVSHAAATKRVLTLDEARKVVASAAAEARRLSAGGAIAVVDDGGHVVAVERLDDTFPAAASVSIAKARTAAVFRRPTRAFEDAIKGGRLSLVAIDEMTPLQGGVPIVIDGQVVGAVGVSGAMSADQDTEIATVAASALEPRVGAKR